MENCLQECARFNKFLATNNVKSLSAYPELEAIFLALCEKGRNLNYQAPPRMKNMWLCFAYWTSDNGSSAEILLKLKTDGPLSDRDFFIQKRDRSTIFKQYREAMVQRHQMNASELDWSEIDDSHLSDEELRPAFKALLKEVNRLNEVVEGKKDRFVICEKSSVSQLMDIVLENGKLRKIDIFQKMWSDMNQPLVVLNEDGRMASLGIKNGEIQELPNPAWLNNLVLYKEGRKIGYGDRTQNGKIEYRSDRNKFKNMAKSEKKGEYDARNYQRKRNAEYLENRNDPQFRPRSYNNQNNDEQESIFFSQRR